jgi:hypothetical protein
MRELFDEALGRRDKTDHDAAWFADDIGIFMSYWYSGLYVVVEGWRTLGLIDPEINSLLKSPHVEELKRYRNGVCHFQKKYLDERFVEIAKDQGAVSWVRELHKSFGVFFLRTYAMADQSPERGEDR